MKKNISYKLWAMSLAIFVFSSFTACLAQDAVDSYTWDFGRIKENKVFSHSFILKNDSNKILNIKSVNTSCGCTVSEIKKWVLKPQETTVVKVKFNSKGYSGAAQQFVYVNTDDLDKPVVKFIIKAEVVK